MILKLCATILLLSKSFTFRHFQSLITSSKKCLVIKIHSVKWEKIFLKRIRKYQDTVVMNNKFTKILLQILWNIFKIKNSKCDLNFKNERKYVRVRNGALKINKIISRKHVEVNANSARRVNVNWRKMEKRPIFRLSLG